MKRLSLTAAASMLGLTLAMSPMTDLQAAELKILAGGSMTGSLNELGPQFERRGPFRSLAHHRYRPRRLRRHRPIRRPQTRRQHTGCAESDAAQHTIRYVRAGERGRRLRLEDIRPARHH
jgi:hypothetical protein